MIEVVEVSSHHVRRGRKSRVIWSALAVNRRSRPYLYDLVTTCSASAPTRAEAVKRARAEARRQGGVS